MGKANGTVQSRPMQRMSARILAYPLARSHAEPGRFPVSCILASEYDEMTVLPAPGRPA